jgi:hypothetical protein
MDVLVMGVCVEGGGEGGGCLRECVCDGVYVRGNTNIDAKKSAELLIISKSINSG